MKAAIRTVDDHGDVYQSLMFACPGCASTRDGYDGLHMLPVNCTGRTSWDWDGSLEAPTLSPSILTKFNWADVEHVCHSFLVVGVWQFLGDCTHALAGQHVPMVDLPDWAVREGA